MSLYSPNSGIMHKGASRDHIAIIRWNTCMVLYLATLKSVLFSSVRNKKQINICFYCARQEL